MTSDFDNVVDMQSWASADRGEPLAACVACGGNWFSVTGGSVVFNQEGGIAGHADLDVKCVDCFQLESVE